MLLLGGDFTTLMAICKGLENGTPVVVVRVCIPTFKNMVTKLSIIYSIVLQ